MLEEETVQILGERYALCVAEKRDEERMHGDILGPFPEHPEYLAECEEWIKTQGSDPDEPLSPECIRALAPRVLEAAKKTWAFLQEHFPRDPRGPTVFM